MAKPSTVPTWATTPTTDDLSAQANTLAPPVAKRAVGWQYREKLARNWLNWWMNLVGQWITWLTAAIASDGLIAASRKRLLPASSGLHHLNNAGWNFGPYGADGTLTDYWFGSVASGVLSFPLELDVGDRITGVSVYLKDTGQAITYKLWKCDPVAGSQTQIGATKTSAANTSAQELALTSLTETIADDYLYKITIHGAASDYASQKVFGASVTFDHP